MKILDGWLFYCADFSIQATGRRGSYGRVMLLRSQEDRAKWHSMPDEIKDSLDCPELYVHGKGATLEEAIADANKMAANAKPIVDGIVSTNLDK